MRNPVCPVFARVAERFAALKAEFEAQLVVEERLNTAIAESLAKVKV